MQRIKQRLREFTLTHNTCPSPSHLCPAGYKEGRQYDYNSPGFSMTSGHFTQIVWQETAKVGCALVPTCSMPTFICHYHPPGEQPRQAGMTGSLLQVPPSAQLVLPMPIQRCPH